MMKQRLFTKVLALVLAFGMFCSVIPAFAAELGKLEVAIDLRNGAVRIEDAGTADRVRYVQVIEGQEISSTDYDPTATQFVFTTNATESSNGLSLLASADLNVTLRNCKLRQDNNPWSNPFNSGDGSKDSGNVRWTLEGENQLWGGKSRWGLRIPPTAVYTVTGSGSLSVKGGAPVGNCNDYGHVSAGMLKMDGGTILVDDDNPINSAITYAGGSIKRLKLIGGASIQDNSKNSLYLQTLDFSDTACEPYISDDNAVAVNGFTLRLDAEKRAYIYLKTGTTSISWDSVVGNAPQHLTIPAVNISGNQVVQVYPRNPLNPVSIDLRVGPVAVRDSDTQGMVYYEQQIDGVMNRSADYDPSNTMFTFTTNGEIETKNGLALLATLPLQVTLKNCKLQQTEEYANPFNSNEGQTEGGNVSFTLIGDSQFWGGGKRWGLRIPQNATYIINGPGSMSVKGGVPIGNCDNNGYLPAGTLWMKSGTLVVKDSNPINANVIYKAGSLRVRQIDGVTIRDADKIPLHLQALDFSDSVCQPYIKGSVVLVNDFPLCLDEAKRVYVYLKEGTNAVEIGNADGSFRQNTPIPPVRVGENEVFVALMAESIAVAHNVHPNANSADLNGFWNSDGGWTERGFEYWIGNDASQATTLVPLQDGENGFVLTGLLENTTYHYRAYGVSGVSGDKIYSNEVEFRTTIAYTVTADGGSVSPPSTLGNNRYSVGDEVTVTANPVESGSMFVGWYEGETLVSDNLSYTFTVEADRILTARTIELSQIITCPDGVTFTAEHTGASSWRYDGAGVLYSGKIKDDQTSGFSLSLTVPEGGLTLAFDWRISSEANYDILCFKDNEVEIDAISGIQSDFASKAVHLSAGQHTIVWNYDKDGSAAKGDDCGYVKNIRLSYAQDVTITASANGNGTVAQGEQTRKQWQETVLTAVPNPGHYLHAWRNADGEIVSYDRVYRFIASETASFTAEFRSSPDYSAAVTGRGISLYPYGGSNALWTAESNGILKSGKIEDGQCSALRGELTVPEGEQRLVTFSWNTSAENYDDLIFYINGEWKDSIFGIGYNWKQNGVLLEAGEYVLEWSYCKDDSVSKGEDGGYLRNITVSTPTAGKITACSSNNTFGIANVTMPNGEPIPELVPAGTMLLFKAEPLGFNAFLGWFDETGTLISDEREFYTVVFGDTDYTARFAEESITYNADTEEAVAVLGKTIYNATLVFAAYDTDGSLVSLVVNEDETIYDDVDLIQPDGVFTPVSGGTVKVFLWESLTTMKPIPLNGNRD